MSPSPIEWIVLGSLTNEGNRTAIFPYNKLHSIRCPDDCRLAALEESGPFEAGFGADMIAPFYDILWYLNTRASVVTSHTSFSSEAFRPNGLPGVGAHIVFLSRDHNHRLNLDETMKLLHSLGNRLANAALQRNLKKGTDHWIRLLPVHVNYWCRLIGDDILIETPEMSDRGYGCQIEICAMADTRPQAAKAWSGACAFTLEAIKPLSKLAEWRTVEPFDHDRHFPFSATSNI
jgi:hypothetical protein